MCILSLCPWQACLYLFLLRESSCPHYSFVGIIQKYVPGHYPLSRKSFYALSIGRQNCRSFDCGDHVLFFWVDHGPVPFEWNVPDIYLLARGFHSGNSWSLTRKILTLFPILYQPNHNSALISGSASFPQPSEYQKYIRCNSAIPQRHATLAFRYGIYNILNMSVSGLGHMALQIRMSLITECELSICKRILMDKFKNCRFFTGAQLKSGNT